MPAAVSTMNVMRLPIAALAAACLLSSGTVSFGQVPRQAPGLVPGSGQPSDLRVRLTPVGRMPSPMNPTSPVVAGSHLLLVDQAGFIFRWDGSTAVPVLTPRTVPREVKLLGQEALINVAATRDGAHVYAMFISSDAPKGLPRRPSPREPDGWYLLYEFAFDGTALSAPRPIVALGVRSEGHAGGGLTVLPDGAVLFSPGDNGDSFEDGRGHAQDPAVHLGKIVRIDPANGNVSVVALGVRAPQRLTTLERDGQEWLAFSDPGGWVSEEVDAIPVAELGAGAQAPNFGWGRNPRDRRAREGTYEIDDLGNARAQFAPASSTTVEPVAEFGRVDTEPIAVSGPVASRVSFSRIVLMFGELVGGQLYAITEPLTARRQPVRQVTAVDEQGRVVSLKALAGGRRPDPRLFSFPDGAAGMLLEATGEFYRLTEVGGGTAAP